MYELIPHLCFFKGLYKAYEIVTIVLLGTLIFYYNDDCFIDGLTIITVMGSR